MSQEDRARHYGRKLRRRPRKPNEQQDATPAATLTQLEFQPDDFATAEEIARRLGYSQTAYTSTSDLIGLFCVRDRATQRAGCVIKTRELGLMFVQDLEDLNLYDLADKQTNARR